MDRLVCKSLRDRPFEEASGMDEHEQNVVAARHESNQLLTMHVATSYESTTVEEQSNPNCRDLSLFRITTECAQGNEPFLSIDSSHSPREHTSPATNIVCGVCNEGLLSSHDLTPADSLVSSSALLNQTDAPTILTGFKLLRTAFLCGHIFHQDCLLSTCSLMQRPTEQVVQHCPICQPIVAPFNHMMYPLPDFALFCPGDQPVPSVDDVFEGRECCENNSENNHHNDDNEVSGTLKSCLSE
jgi:hypothetical protein